MVEYPNMFTWPHHAQVWQMRTGPRLLTIQCSKGCRLLQPTYRFGSSLDSTYVPLEVFLLNGDSGQLSVLNRFLNWILHRKFIYCLKFDFFAYIFVCFPCNCKLRFHEIHVEGRMIVPVMPPFIFIQQLVNGKIMA